MVYQFQFEITDGIFWRENKVQRTIEIAASRTLEDLCTALLGSLNFDFDHLYEFQIQGRSYEGAPYYASSQERCRVKLYSLNLQKGDTFTLIYDFGDEWTFHARVLDVTDSKGGPARIIRSVGEVEQYPSQEDLIDWDDDIDSWDPDDDDWEDEQYLVRQVWNYQPSEALFDVAYRYKKTRLWDKLNEGQVFAVAFSDGSIGFVSVMGKAGKHCALGIHVGEKAFDSFRRLSFEYPMLHDMDEFDWMLQLDCLQITFDTKDYLRYEEEAAARSYARSHGIRLSGKNAFAHFQKFEPNRIPWHPDESIEEQYMIEAAEAAIALAEMLQSKLMQKLDIPELDPMSESIPCMVKEANGLFRLASKPIPIHELGTIIWPESSPIPEFTVKRLKKLPKRNTIECRLKRLEEPILEDPEKAPFLPLGLFMREAREGYVIPPLLMPDYEENPDQARDHFVQTLQELGYRPEKICVCEERTFALMDPLADQIGTECTFVDELPILEDFVDDLIAHMRGADDLYEPFDYEDVYDDDISPPPFDASGMAEWILQMPDDTVATMPKEGLLGVRMMIESGELSPELARKLRKKCGL